MLASDAIESKIKFPCIIQPKIDGVRALNIDGKLVGRSLKSHANKHTTDFYSQDKYNGLDGELIAAAPTDPAVCRLTTSAVSTIAGYPYTVWNVFDLINEETKGMVYNQRLWLLNVKVTELDVPHLVRVVESHLVHSLEELLLMEQKWLDMGYEGIIVRDPNGLHKQGRSTVKEGGLLRIKRFVDAEAMVILIQEGETNTNEATTNELGNTSRSTHQANMVPNGMVGAMVCKDIKTGDVITVAAGCMSHEERTAYFQDQTSLVGHIIKYKYFPKGIKDKPRFPTFQSIRTASDIGV